MSLPSGYVAWCQMLGLNAYHPAEWTEAERTTVIRWKVEKFRARWRWRMRHDYPALVRTQSGRRALIDQVREELRQALAPIPSRPYKTCPCHPHRLGGVRDQPAPWRAVLEAQPYLEGLPPGDLAVAWLEAGAPLPDRRR
jgi:hypothetical protein